jgi:DNA-binding NtrC family response regulator
VESTARILLVDDDDGLRSVLERTLNARGYAVTGVSDRNTALDVLHHQTFDVVLLDIALPDGNGLAILDLLKQPHLASRVIVLTGTVGLENAVRSAILGVHDYITKPFTFNYLLRSIQHVLAKHSRQASQAV